MPLFFSISSFEVDTIVTALIGFLAFSLTASIIYCINDLKDIELDKKHPVKKNRPLASGKISVKCAYITIVTLIVIAGALCAYLFYKSGNIGSIIIPAVYLVLNLAYSLKLKNIPILDIVILSSGFLLRLMFGGSILDIEVSKYLYLTIIFGAFYLGFGKRRNEIIKNGNNSRKVLEYYNKEFLDKNMYVALTLAMVSYTLWTVLSDASNDYLFWTVPLVLVIFQMYSLDIEGNSHGDPIEVVLSNKYLLLLIIVYFASLVGILYFL